MWIMTLHFLWSLKQKTNNKSTPTAWFMCSQNSSFSESAKIWREELSGYFLVHPTEQLPSILAKQTWGKIALCCLLYNQPSIPHLYLRLSWRRKKKNVWVIFCIFRFCQMICKYKKRNIAASSQYEDLMHQVRCSEKESRNRTKKHPDSLINVATKL